MATNTDRITSLAARVETLERQLKQLQTHLKTPMPLIVEDKINLPNGRLRPGIREELIEYRERTGKSYAQIGAEYGVSGYIITRIIKGDRWK